MKRLRTLKSFQIFKTKIKKSKTYRRLMSFTRPIQYPMIPLSGWSNLGGWYLWANYSVGTSCVKSEEVVRRLLPPTPSTSASMKTQPDIVEGSVEGLYCKRPIQCMASSKYLPPTPVKTPDTALYYIYVSTLLQGATKGNAKGKISMLAVPGENAWCLV